MFGSRFYSLARRNPRAGLAGLKLWWEAWMQCPAASLPCDDFDLAHLAGFGEDLDGWAAIKGTALHGFILCADERLYHPFLASEAVKAFDIRLKSDKRRAIDRVRLQSWRDARKQSSALPARANFDRVNATSVETRFNTMSETASETLIVVRDQDQDQDQRKKDLAAQDVAAPLPRQTNRTALPKSKSPAARGTRLPIDWQPGPEYVAFARSGGLNPAAIALRFRDHWHAKAGKDACKVSWLATWRNWCRREHGWREPGAVGASTQAGPVSSPGMNTITGRSLTAAELFEVST
jgi:hypothetical protein